MKPSEVASRIGIAATTVRAWTAGEFKQYMSPGGRGGDGSGRNLTEQDARILARIAYLKDNGARADEIHVDLQRMAANDWVDLPDLPEVPGSQRVAVVPRSTAETALSAERRALLTEIARLEKHLEDSEKRLDKAHDENQKLLREIGDMREKIGELATELRLYKAGRLKPENSTD